MAASGCPISSAGNSFKLSALRIESILCICGVMGDLHVNGAGAKSPIAKFDRMDRKPDELVVLEQWVSTDHGTLTTKRPSSPVYDQESQNMDG
jgi:hypothetical protein